MFVELSVPWWATLFPVVGFGFFEAALLFTILTQTATTAYALANAPKPPELPKLPEPPKPDLAQEAGLKEQAVKRARQRARTQTVQSRTALGVSGDTGFPEGFDQEE